MLRLAVLLLVTVASMQGQPLPGTAALEWRGDSASLIVEQLHSFLDSYSRPATKPDAARLAYVLGVTESRSTPAMEVLATKGRLSAIRWQVFRDLHGEGLLLNPASTPRMRVVALPDADQTPEEFIARFLNSGAQVIVPLLMDRKSTYSGAPQYRMTNMPHREFLWRILYPLGRHIAGVEIQKTLAAIDWFERQTPRVPIAVAGYGEGGMIALNAAALDPRIATTLVSGYFGPRDKLLWTEPVYRDVWGLLPDYTDRALAAMIAPRKLLVDINPGPVVDGPPMETKERRGAAPHGKLRALSDAEVRLAAEGVASVTANGFRELFGASGVAAGPIVDAEQRFERQFREVVDYSRRLIRESSAVRDKLWSSRTPDQMRELLWRDMIGRLPDPSLPPNARTRLLSEHESYRVYEVLLDVWSGVNAYGYLLVPKNIPGGERRPAVVCQHGLEGRPKDVADPDFNHPTYKQFAVRLAEMGFVTFSPQNPYVLGDRFRQINRKAHPWALTQFSFVTGQHQQIVNWLRSLDFVIPDRVGFYGLSYGGYTAMRIPALVTDYALSINSGNFTEWVWKVASLDAPYTYPLTGEYDIPEFNFAHLTNHYELATLIYPRPFMVERGHRDGVSWDEWVAFEYAKVFRFYSQRGKRDLTEIEYFDGPHQINGVGTYSFLKKHLQR